MNMSLPAAARLLCVALAATTVACVQTPPAPAAAAHGDHSHSRGRAPEHLGRVAFANSCSAAVQPQFERAVALLHSFWWREGENAFREVLDRDPSCAIATWGLATVLAGNPFATGSTAAQAQQAAEAIERGRAIGAKTERERLYVEAVARYYERYAERSHGARLKSLSQAFEELAARFPEDDETQVFSALYLAATQDPADKTFARTLKAAAILERQFDRRPDHPGVAHYLIHSYDYPPIAQQGLAAAKRYAVIAASAPHALHMPSHIFTRVGAWQESAASNRESARVAEAQREFSDRLHAMDYLAYAYLQLARDADVRRVVEEARGVPDTEPTRATHYAIAAIPARYAIERGAWKEAAQLEARPTRFPFTTAFTHFARALGAARSGDAAAAERDVQELARLVDALKAAKDAYWTTEVEAQRLGAAAWMAYAKGETRAALDLMRAAADLEDGSEKAAVSPGRLVPARELLADMLLESSRPAEALVEYERSQLRDPNRFRSLYGAGRAAAAAGDAERARRHYGRLSELAAAGESRPETEQARSYLARR